MKSLRVSLACCLFATVFAVPLAAQDKKLTPVYLGYSAISGSFAPLWVGFDQGLFAKHGLDLKMAYIQGNRVMMSALKPVSLFSAVRVAATTGNCAPPRRY